MAKFTKGQSGNPAGRPPRAVEERRLSILAELFDEDAERAVIRKQIAVAKKGSLASAAWLFDRKYGKPKEPAAGRVALTLKQLEAMSDEDLEDYRQKMSRL